MRTSTYIRWSGVALMLWALHLLVRDYTFAFSHGTAEEAMGQTLLGLTASQWDVVWTAFAALSVVGFAGVYVLVSARLGKVGRSGLLVALLGLTLWFVAQVMQFWILDVDKFFHSPLVYGGWLLQIGSLFVLTAGLVIAGIAIQRANALPRGRSVILLLGLLSLPTFLSMAYLVEHSDGGLSSQLLYGSLSVPWDLCWLWLGYVLITGAASATWRTPRPASRG